jgi:hypothetical protein
LFLGLLLFPIPLWTNLSPGRSLLTVFLYISFLILIFLNRRRFIRTKGESRANWSEIFGLGFITGLILFLFYYENYFKVEVGLELIFYLFRNFVYLQSDILIFLSVSSKKLFSIWGLFLIGYILISRFQESRFITLLSIGFLVLTYVSARELESLFSKGAGTGLGITLGEGSERDRGVRREFIEIKTDFGLTPWKKFKFSEPPDIFIILVEGVGSDYFSDSEIFRMIPQNRFLKIQNCFISMPHSSKSLFTLLTGELQLTQTRPNKEEWQSSESKSREKKNQNLWKKFTANGYKSYLIYNQPFAVENLDWIGKEFFTNSIDSKGLDHWNQKNGKGFQKFEWGMDDFVLLPFLEDYLEIPDNSKNFENLENRENQVQSSRPIAVLAATSNTHSPYFTPELKDRERLKMGEKERYLVSVERTKVLIRELYRSFVSKRGKFPLFVLVSDHGESFGEKGYWKHNFSLWNSETKVPCYLAHPSFPENAAIPWGGLPDVYKLLGFFSDLDPGRSNQNGLSWVLDSDRKFPMKTWNSDRAMGLIDNSGKKIYIPSEGKIYKSDWNESKIETSNIGREIQEFIIDWTRTVNSF